MLVIITNFPFLIDSLKPCTPKAKTKRDKSFLLVFPNTSFPFSQTYSLKHPAEC